MVRNDYLCFENSSGQEVILSSPDITRWFELRGRTGFTAPEIENVTQKYANGVTKILKRIIQPRNVTVSMIVLGETKAERDAMFFNMVSRLMDVNGNGTGKLYVRRSDGMIVYLNCAYSSGLSIFEEYRTLHRFTLEFYAPDPWFYADLDDAYIQMNKDNFLTLSDSLIIGNNHRLGEFTSKGSGDITNAGTEIIQPVIRLNGVRGDVTIVNDATGASISMRNMSMIRDQVLVIDTRDESKNIYLKNRNGSTKQASQYLEWNNTSYEFPIVPGKNHISYDGSIGSAIDKLTFSMSQKYLSA